MMAVPVTIPMSPMDIHNWYMYNNIGMMAFT